MKKTFLKPCLLICLGLVVTTIAVASVRAFGPPTPPREPKVDNVTANSCIVSYLAPESDGGTPIKLYEIECQEHGSKTWTSKGGTHDLSHEITGMRKGSTVKFRIAAINGVGRSIPAETKEITFEDKHIAR